MRQLSLTYKPSVAAKAAMDDFLEAMQQAVLHLGLKEVTFEFDIAKSTLSEALSGKGERRWAEEWTFGVLAMLDHRGTETCAKLAKAIHDAQMSLSSRFMVTERDEFTAEEIAAAERVLEIAKKRRRAA